ncbi:MAG: serine hydrolase [Candidatus Omnitrophota bacterium]|nr:serine hydrolase [Candidatus Omnitrophota bacterium]
MKIVHKNIYGIVVSLFVVAGMLAGCSEEPLTLDISGRCAVIREMKNGKVLYEKNPDDKFPPASTAKIMTALIVLEKIDPNEYIVSTPEAVKVEPTVAGLAGGVSYKAKDLISALMIKSGNDAARVIAHHIAGSEELFARMMNDKAKELGMNDTYFANASGLPAEKKDTQYITAKDLCTLMRYAAGRKDLLETMSLKQDEIIGSDKKSILLKTHNKALLKREDGPWGKTGYTKEAKRTFAGVDPSLEPKIVFAVLQSEDLWKDICALNDQGLIAYEKSHRSLLEMAIGWVKALVNGKIVRS